MSHAKRAYFDALLRDVGLDLGGRVLELGGAEGDCATALRTRWPGANLTVVEPHAPASEALAAAGARGVAQPVETWLAETSDEAFDVVLALDVLEHLRAPLETVARIAERLRPEGHLVATFPNADALSRRLLGRLWPQYKSEHLVYFARRAVEALAVGAGLETVRLAPLAKRLPVDYFLAVGAASGPAPLRRASAALRRCVPAPIGRRVLPLRTGEWLWIARRR